MACKAYYVHETWEKENIKLSRKRGKGLCKSKRELTISVKQNLFIFSHHFSISLSYAAYKSMIKEDEKLKNHK